MRQLAMTFRENDENIARALDGGADDCLSKPFDAEQLLARLRSVHWEDNWVSGPDQVFTPAQALEEVWGRGPHAISI